MSEPIELITVWKWVCTACSHANYEDPPTIEVTEEDCFMQPEFDSEGEYACRPETVLCSKCLALFDVIPYDDEDNEASGFDPAGGYDL